MTQYKYSQYNIEIDTKPNGDIFLFNTYSSKGKWIPRADYDDIKDNQSIDLGDVPVYLAKEQFIVPNNLDEYERLQREIYNVAHDSKKLQFIIATTKACNYRCHYCYEGQYLSSEKMQQDTMDNIVAYIIRKCRDRSGLKEIILQWFGGETLLHTEPIRYITAKLKKEYADEHNIEIRGHITTNGRLLTRKVVDEMVSDYCIKSVQITLDGMAKDYARIKGCTEDDFHKVIENIKYAQDKLTVHIRLNLYENLESLKKLLDYIDEEKLIVSVYIAHIFDVSQTPDKYQSDYRFFTYEHNNLMQYIIDNKYTYMIGGIPKPVCKRLVCKANTDWQYVIDIYGIADNSFRRETQKMTVIFMLVVKVINTYGVPTRFFIWPRKR